MLVEYYVEIEENFFQWFVIDQNVVDGIKDVFVFMLDQFCEEFFFVVEVDVDCFFRNVCCFCDIVYVCVVIVVCGENFFCFVQDLVVFCWVFVCVEMILIFRVEMVVVDGVYLVNGCYVGCFFKLIFN